MGPYLRATICVLVLAWPTCAKVDARPRTAVRDDRFGSVGMRCKPGDKVQIHYRAAPYREKFSISSRGKPDAHITVIGISGPNGEQPVITGENATTGRNMDYRWTNPNYQQSLGVLEIGYRRDGPKRVS